MPVKCPMSGIIKQRKHQGRDYFEVSWENIDGLKQSTVPADLVQRYTSRKMGKKKKNSLANLLSSSIKIVRSIN